MPSARVGRRQQKTRPDALLNTHTRIPRTSSHPEECRPSRNPADEPNRKLMEESGLVSDGRPAGVEQQPKEAAPPQVSRKPPDGGARAWLVMMGSFLCNGILLGIINSFGVLHTYLQKSLQDAGDADASSKAGELSGCFSCFEMVLNLYWSSSYLSFSWFIYCRVFFREFHIVPYFICNNIVCPVWNDASTKYYDYCELQLCIFFNTTTNIDINIFNWNAFNNWNDEKFHTVILNTFHSFIHSIGSTVEIFVSIVYS